MIEEAAAYHLNELRVALDPSDAHHILPPIDPIHRRVLDIGCGAGQTLLACQCQERRLAVGIDPSLPAVTLGRSLDTRLRLICGVGEWLPFASGSFDLVYSRVALPYMRIDRAIAEMARVLRPGGTLWLTLHPLSRVIRDTMAEARQLHLRAVLHGAYVIGNGLALHALGRTFAWPFGHGGYESFQTTEAMRRCLARAGFEAIAIERSRFFVARARRRP